VAVVAGVVVPELLARSPAPALGPTGATTSAPSPASSAPVSPGPTTVTTAPRPTTVTTAPPSSAPRTTTPARTAGRTLSDGVVSVSLPSGWAVEGGSSPGSVVLDGPGDVSARFLTRSEPSSVTLAQVFQTEVGARLQEDPGATVCMQPRSANVPNGPPGEEMALCFTSAAQNGPAVPYIEYDFAGIVQDPLLVESDIFAPQSMAPRTLANEVAPLLRSVHWPELGRTGGGAYARLAGDWLGPFPGPPGACGLETGEWSLYSSGSYSFTTNSQKCGGFTVYGRFSITGNVITFDQQGNAVCPTCAQKVTYSETFSFPAAGALQLCGTTAGAACYTYYRQG
jgi:hypothetical protein